MSHDFHLSGVNSFTFFIFDHTVLKKEEDDLKDAIIYFHPQVDGDTQCALVGQIIGMSEFFGNSFPQSRPSLIKLYHDKFAVRKKGDYTLAFGVDRSFPDVCLQQLLDFLWQTFVFYQCSFEFMKQNLKSEFLFEIQRLWDIYVRFCGHFGDVVGQMIHMVPTVDLPKSCSSLFLHASHILQQSVHQPHVMAGTILYRNQSLCSQLPPDITKRLLLLKPKQSHCSKSRIKTDFELPEGIRLLKVFLTKQEYESLRPTKNLRSSKKKHGKKMDSHLTDLQGIGVEQLDISGVSFLECSSGNVDDGGDSSLLETESLISDIKMTVESLGDIIGQKEADFHSSGENTAKISASVSKAVTMETAVPGSDSAASIDNAEETVTMEIHKSTKHHVDSSGHAEKSVKKEISGVSDSATENICEELKIKTCPLHDNEQSTSSDSREESSSASLDDQITEKINMISKEIDLRKSEKQTRLCVKVKDSEDGKTADSKPIVMSEKHLTKSVLSSVKFDTTSSDDLSIGESHVDPKSLRKSAKQALLSTVPSERRDVVPCEGDSENSAKDGKIFLNPATDGTSPVDSNNERTTSVNSENVETMSLSSKNEGTLSLTSEKDGTISGNSSKDGIMSGNSSKDGTRSVEADKDVTMSLISGTEESISEITAIDGIMPAIGGTISAVHETIPANSAFDGTNPSNTAVDGTKPACNQPIIPDEKLNKTMEKSSEEEDEEDMAKTSTPAVVTNNVVPVNLGSIDLIKQQEEDKLLKSSGSSITSEETAPQNLDSLEFISNQGSIDSFSPTPASKKSVTFSYKAGTSDDTVQSSENPMLSPVSNCDLSDSTSSQELPSNDLLDVTLYVQGHSDMMLLLFLEKGSKCEAKNITNLWKFSLSHLAELDYEVKECLNKTKSERRSKQGLGYHFLKYDPLLKTASGNSLDPITSVGYDFINTAGKMHNSFVTSKTTTEALFRTHTGCCYGSRTFNNESFFQLAAPTRQPGGCPSPKDVVFSLDQIAAQKLHANHETML